MPSLASPGRPARGLLARALVCVALACGPTDPPAPSDADGPGMPRTPAPARPSVVSLSLPASHFVRALGAESLLVGVDASSARLPGLADLPVVDDLADAAILAPDLVLLASPPSRGEAQAPCGPDITCIAFAPHDLEDALELVREVGGRLVGEARAESFAYRLTRPLAAIGGASVGRPRPRVLAVVAFDPLRVAGGHSFETDLIEIAGGRSLTHESEQPSLALDPAAWAEPAPDLVLVVTSDPLDADRRRALRHALPLEWPVAFFPFDAELFWLRDPVEPARRLQDLLEPVVRRLERAGGP